MPPAIIGSRSLRAHQKRRALRLGGPGMTTLRTEEGWVWVSFELDIFWILEADDLTG